MQQIVFNSDFQDEVACVDPVVAGLVFQAGIPSTVTDEQADILLTNPCFSVHDGAIAATPPIYYEPPPPPPAEYEPEDEAAI